MHKRGVSFSSFIKMGRVACQCVFSRRTNGEGGRVGGLGRGCADGRRDEAENGGCIRGGGM